MAVIKKVNVTGANKDTAAATAGGTKTHFQVFASDGVTPKSNPTALTTARTIAAGGKLNVADAGVHLTLGRATKITAVNTTDDTIQLSADHGFSANQQLLFRNSAGALPGGLSANTVYYVIATGLTASVFKVSTSQGGAAVDLTSAGTGTNSVIIPGELDDDLLITLLGEGTGELADTDVLKFGEDAAMTNASDIANYAVDAWDAAEIW